MVVYEIHVVAEGLHHGTELLLAWDVHGRDLGGGQSRLVLPSVGLIGHHAERHGQKEVATALEGPRVAPQHVEALALRVTMRLEDGVVGESATAMALLVQIQGSTIDTLAFLDLLLFGTTKELLHRVFEIE